MIRFFEKIPALAYLSFIGILALILRALRLDARSLWMDELYSVSDTNPVYSFSKIWKNHLFNTHPPLNYIIQWVWYKIFGYNDLQARIPPMIFGVISVLAIYFLVKELIDKRTGLAASFLMAVNIFHIEYSQEARSYSLLCLMAIVQFYFFVKLLKEKRLIWIVLTALAGALLVYTHYTGLFLLVSQVLIIGFLFLFGDVKKIKLWKYLAPYPAVLLLILPLIPSILWLKQGKIAIDSIPKTDIMANYFSYYFGEQYTLVSIFALFLIVALINFASTEKEESKSYHLAFLVVLTWILTGLLLPYYRSITEVPTMHIRYTISVFPAFIILIAFGISRIKNLPFLIFSFVTIIILVFINIHAEKRYYANQLWKADYRGLVKEIVKTNKIYPVWDLGSDGFADPVEPWAFYFRQNGIDPPFINLNADSSKFLSEKGVWLIKVLYSRDNQEKIDLMKRHGFVADIQIDQFHGCNATLMTKK